MADETTKSSAKQVTAAKPKVGGAISWAPAGTAVPTDATTALNEAFKSLGYISTEGLKNNSTPESVQVKAWGGDTVLSSQTGKIDTFTFTLIEDLYDEVHKFIHGADNVSGSLATGLVVKVNGKELGAKALVADMIMRGNVKKRVVVPYVEIMTIAEVSYKDDDAVGYQVTVNASPDDAGNTHYEYYKSAT